MSSRLLRGLLLAMAALTLSVAQAASFKWASQDDATTLDPHAFNHGMTLTLLNHIYEGLVRRDKDMRIEPGLAVRWEQPTPTSWVFHLRQGVRFHDGSPLTAEDVAFSIERAMHKDSDMKVFAASIVSAKARDASTVVIETAFPNAALLQSLPELRVMSKGWSERNNATTPANMRMKQENAATRQANGTGPFKLESREPDVRTVMVRNEQWWGKHTTNIQRAELVKISSDATRVAALLSGEVDFAYPIPLQDVPRLDTSDRVKVMQGPEIRVMFLSLDQGSDELKYANVKGKNPFKDQRVRQALYQAIDIEAIRTRIMRNSVKTTGILVATGVNSVDPAASQRQFPFDPEAASRLMAQAGYGSGFEVTLDCPNDRYVNDEQVCIAVASMLARIGIKVAVNPLPAARFFQKIGSGDSSFNFFGYTPSNLDAYNTLEVIMASRQGGSGQWNVGRYSNPQVDALIQRVLSEMDPRRRTELVTQALSLHKQDVGHIPLYQQGLAWGMKKSVDAVLQIDNRVNLNHISVK